MPKLGPKTILTLFGAVAGMSLMTSMLATVTADDVAAYQRSQHARLFTAPRPGALYQIVDGQLDSEPVCWLQTSGAIQNGRPKMARYRNQFGYTLPVFARLGGIVNPADANSPFQTERVEHFSRRNLNRRARLTIHPDCEDDVEYALASGAHVCVVSSVFLDVESEEPLRVRMKKACMTRCEELQNGDVCPNPAADLAEALSAPLISRIKIKLGLITDHRLPLMRAENADRTL